MLHRASSTAYAALGLAALLVAGCSREDVTHYRVEKPAPAPSSAIPASTGPGLPGGSELAAPPRAGGLRWTLPTGWTESAGGQMRFATLRPPVTGRIDASVVMLPGPAGGELANVNRWRNQIGLPPIDEAGLASARKPLASRAGQLAVYDFSSDAQKSRVVAGLTEHEGATWFVKLSGDAAAVEAARPDFMKLLGSLRFDASSH